MILFFLFLFLGLYFAWLYAFSKERFSPANLMLAIWLVSIGIAQLRLSQYEGPWSINFWLILLLFFILFYLFYKIVTRKASNKIIDSASNIDINKKLFFIITVALSVSSLLANLYIFWQFDTMPVFSTNPDKMRFIINKNIFGLWEYISLLPRLYIPLLLFFLLSAKKVSLKYKYFIWVNIILGFLLLMLYASRLIIILPILLSYFVYLYLRKKELNLKKIIISSLVVLIVVGAISVIIPAFRNYITYKDYYTDTPDYTPFTYLADISGINLPAGLNWVIPLYLIPSFNLQAMMQATTFYTPALNNYYGGGYYVSAFNPLLQILHLPISNVVIPWKPIFLYWWITATFLFSAWADFGYIGIIFISCLWGAVLALAYQYATKKPTYLSIMLMAYLSFVVIMSIYTDYLIRAEFYMDISFICIVGLIFCKFKE